MGSNTKIFRKLLLQSRSEWLRSELTTHHPANQVENVETNLQQHQYYYTEELSNQLLNQLLNEINPNQEIVFSIYQSPEHTQFMGNQQQAAVTGGITQVLPSQETVKPKTQVTKSLSDIGEQLNIPVIGK